MPIKATKSKIRNQKKILDTYTQIVLKAQENIEEKIEKSAIQVNMFPLFFSFPIL
jgi:hypothetical protein